MKMGALLEKVKTLLEVDVTEPIYDDQLLLLINGGISYLLNNGIPVAAVDDSTTFDDFAGLTEPDRAVVLQWLFLWVLQRFDMTTMSDNKFTVTTGSWIADELDNLLYMLKVQYGT